MNERRATITLGATVLVIAVVLLIIVLVVAAYELGAQDATTATVTVPRTTPGR